MSCSVPQKFVTAGCFYRPWACQ
uniref:Uncharacterized protein n=1 Tax=Anguilla anguilla TaxID=7936 RepID=A0A0E9W384_ANGAN